MKILPLRPSWLLLSFALWPASSGAQSLGVVLKQGDTLSTGERVTAIREARIDDDGSWLALVDTDLADLNQDGVLLRDGVIVLREGSALSVPAGSTLDDWDQLGPNALGDLGAILRVRLTSLAVVGAYWNGVKVALKDQVIDAPPFDAHAVDTDWETMKVVKLNSSNQMFVLGEVANPALARTRERALVRYQLDSAGNILETNVLATEGMTVATSITLTGSSCLILNEGILAVNEHGDTITFVAEDATQALVINMQTVVAMSGGPAPNGNVWANAGAFNLSRVGINDSGEYVHTGALASLNFMIVKNGQKFAQEGDVLPVVGSVGGGSSPPLLLANSGDVYWHTRGGNGDAFLRNHDVIVLSQSTVVGGQLVTLVRGDENAFHASRDGRFWAGLVQLQGVGDALLTTDFGLVVPVPGCASNPGVLTKVGGDARAGAQLSLEMDNGQASGVTPVLFFCSSPAVPGSPCGVTGPHGEVLVDITTEVATRIGPAWTGTPTRFDLNFPPRMSLVGLESFAQGVFWDAAGSTGAPPLRLTNGLRLEIGAP